MSRFFIVNSVDRPCKRLIAEKREDGLLYYIFNETHKEGMSLERATPLEAFGFCIFFDQSENCFKFDKNNDSVAAYPDGSIREWQDSELCFEYIK